MPGVPLQRRHVRAQQHAGLHQLRRGRRTHQQTAVGGRRRRAAVGPLDGKAGGADLAVQGLFALPLAKLRAEHEGWMPAYMGG